MADLLNPVSLLIDLSFPWFEADSKVLRHPAGFRPRESRIVLHETIHYWQHLGQGYLMLRVQEDWKRLLEFEKTGKPSKAGEQKLRFLRKGVVPNFSALDLHECLARFWDVHVIGPVNLMELELKDDRRRLDESVIKEYVRLKSAGKLVRASDGAYSSESYDLAMYSAAGNYAVPYRLIRNQTESQVAGTILPLAGHFAFQTKDPVHSFRRIVDILLGGALPEIPREQNITDLWEQHYPLIWRVADAVKKDQHEPTLFSGMFMQRGSLSSNRVYQWAYRTLRRALEIVPHTKLAAGFSKKFPRAEPEALSLLMLDFMLSCPGTPENRAFLIDRLAPPCLRFGDCRIWKPAGLWGLQLYRDMPDIGAQIVEESTQAAEASLDIAERWKAFRTACRGY